MQNDESPRKSQSSAAAQHDGIRTSDAWHCAMRGHRAAIQRGHDRRGGLECRVSPPGRRDDTKVFNRTFLAMQRRKSNIEVIALSTVGADGSFIIKGNMHERNGVLITPRPLATPLAETQDDVEARCKGSSKKLLTYVDDRNFDNWNKVITSARHTTAAFLLIV